MVCFKMDKEILNWCQRYTTFYWFVTEISQTVRHRKKFTMKRLFVSNPTPYFNPQYDALFGASLGQNTEKERSKDDHSSLLHPLLRVIRWPKKYNGKQKKCGQQNQEGSLIKQTLGDEGKKFYSIETRAQCYKSFHGCKLRIFVMSLSVCPWQTYSVVCRQGQKPTLEWSI